MIEVVGKGYVGQVLAMADVLSVLYFHVLNYRANDPGWEGRDRFFLSHGHMAVALYGALIEAGILPEEEIPTYGQDDSRFPISTQPAYTPGVEIASGTLGHGLGIAVGSALTLRRRGNPAFMYCMTSDGEINEGSVWEAALNASKHKLSNLIVVMDNNDMQNDGPSSEVMNLEPIHDKWTAFGFEVWRVDGNDISALCQVFDEARASTSDRPRMIICDNQMGKGVSFLEHREKQVHFTPWSKADLDRALIELGERT